MPRIMIALKETSLLVLLKRKLRKQRQVSDIALLEKIAL